MLVATAMGATAATLGSSLMAATSFKVRLLLRY